MSGGDDLHNFFNNLFGGGGDGMPQLPAPNEMTFEQKVDEAMSVTRVHLEAYKVSQTPKGRTPAYFDMLPSWKEEFSHYLPILEAGEEYERCADVFKAMKDIEVELANLSLNKELNELDIRIDDSLIPEVDTTELPDNDESDEIDF